MFIVSASGMATGGRVLHHLARRLGDHRNTILIVGFQAPGTRGDALRAGARQLKLHGKMHQVKAKVVSIALSAHADQSELLRWLASAEPRPGAVYVNHGEPDASAALVAEITARFGGARHGVGAEAVTPGQQVRLG